MTYHFSFSADERQIIVKAKILEPEITKEIETVSANTELELFGLEFRLKTEKSVFEKAYCRGEESIAVDKQKDLIRYTLVAESENLIEKAINAISQLKEKDFTIIQIKNTWLTFKPTYRGINCVVAFRGQVMEVQFHTYESFKLKNEELHLLYEKQRIIKKNTSEYNNLKNKMVELSSKLKAPKDIEKLDEIIK